LLAGGRVALDRLPLVDVVDDLLHLRRRVAEAPVGGGAWGVVDDLDVALAASFFYLMWADVGLDAGGVQSIMKAMVPWGAR